LNFIHVANPVANLPNNLPVFYENRNYNDNMVAGEKSASAISFAAWR
jgi:hypothetical protein